VPQRKGAARLGHAARIRCIRFIALQTGPAP
jgi:hypothetical protein